MKNFSKCFVALMILSATILPGCKKDGTGISNESANLTTRAASSEHRSPDVIVHTGSSIQAAVTAADAGSIIQIEPGIYNEAIVVNKPGIQLIGSADGVIIQNPGDA